MGVMDPTRSVVIGGTKVGKVQNWFYRKTLIPGIPLPSDSPPLLILILMIMRRGLGRRVACRSQDRP